MSMAKSELIVLAVSSAMAVAAGLIGSFSIMRQMSLAADPMSHIALPGIGIALLLGASPLIGAVAMLLCGALLIWVVERRTHIATEAIIGVTFSVALAVGSMITSGEELIEALFGSVSSLQPWEVVLGLAASLAVVTFVFCARNALVVALISPDLALTSKVNVSRLDLSFLLAFALTIGMGLRYLGVLLMGSLLIIPPAIGRRFARSLNGMLLISATIAVAATVVGTWVAVLTGRQSGPLIVLVAGGLFFLSLAFRSR
ncbi:MAG TPA: metal ABC transporter permease [Steroidobacteraceae bacterium]|nr:metal ABC transporter permease [Steroidobacteraceae bacterium]